MLPPAILQAAAFFKDLKDSKDFKVFPPTFLFSAYSFVLHAIAAERSNSGST